MSVDFQKHPLSKGAELGSWLLTTLNQVATEGEKARQKAQEEQFAQDARDQADKKKAVEQQQLEQHTEADTKRLQAQKDAVVETKSSEAADTLSALRNLNTSGINLAAVFGLQNQLENRAIGEVHEVLSVVNPNAGPFDPEGSAAIKAHEALFEAKREFARLGQPGERPLEKELDPSLIITVNPGQEIYLVDPNQPAEFAVAPHPANPKVFLAAGTIRLSDSPVGFTQEPDGSFRSLGTVYATMDTARIVFPNGEVRFGGFPVTFAPDTRFDIPLARNRAGEETDLRTAA